jgi:hypothetical protein
VDSLFLRDKTVEGNSMSTKMIEEKDVIDGPHCIPKKIDNFEIPCKTLFCLIHFIHHQNGNWSNVLE